MSSFILPPTQSPPQPIEGFLYNLQGWEILIIFFVILLLFGAKKLPELARGIGKAIREFKSTAHDAQDSFRQALDNPPSPSPGADNQAEKKEEPESKTLSEPK